MVQQRIAGTDGLRRQGLHLRKLAKVALGNRQYAGELWRDELVAFCEANPSLAGTSGPVDVSGACPVLAAWDVRDDLDSAGAILFRRFVSRLLANFQSLPTGVSAAQRQGESAIYDVPFDPADAGQHAARAQHRQPGRRHGARRRGHRPRAAPASRSTARCASSSTRPAAASGSRSTAAPGRSACSTRSTSAWDAKAGYPNVPHGTSFIAAMGFKRKGCPAKALTFVTYGQTENQASPHAADYTKAFSRKKWNRVPFCARRGPAQDARGRAGRGWVGVAPAEPPERWRSRRAGPSLASLFVNRDRRIALVTGASSGIGEATVRALAGGGLRDGRGGAPAGALRAARAPRSAGGRCGSTSPTRTRSRRSPASCPSVDLIVHSAGGALGLEPVAEADEEHWREMWESNVAGVMRVTKALLPALRGADRRRRS